MTVEELINMGASKVRRDSHLLRLYIDFFQNKFGYKPNCVSCTFSTDFYKLVKAVAGKSITQYNEMAQTFIIKRKKGEILSYRLGNKVVRRYDTSLTEEFVIGFLTHGTDAELTERRKMFSKLPDAIAGTKEETPVITLEKDTPALEPEKEIEEPEADKEPAKEETPEVTPKKRGRKPKSDK